MRFRWSGCLSKRGRGGIEAELGRKVPGQSMRDGCSPGCLKSNKRRFGMLPGSRQLKQAHLAGEDVCESWRSHRKDYWGSTMQNRRCFAGIVDGTRRALLAELTPGKSRNRRRKCQSSVKGYDLMIPLAEHPHKSCRSFCAATVDSPQVVSAKPFDFEDRSHWLDDTCI